MPPIRITANNHCLFIIMIINIITTHNLVNNNHHIKKQLPNQLNQWKKKDNVIVIIIIKKMGMREELELEEEKKKRTNTHKCIPHNIYFSPFFLFHIIYKLPFLLLLKHLGRHASLYTCKCITSSHVYIYRYKKKRCLPGEWEEGQSGACASNMICAFL